MSMVFVDNNMSIPLMFPSNKWLCYYSFGFVSKILRANVKYVCVQCALLVNGWLVDHLFLVAVGVVVVAHSRTIPPLPLNLIRMLVYLVGPLTRSQKCISTMTRNTFFTNM